MHMPKGLTRRWVKLAVGGAAIAAMTLPVIALSAPAGASPNPEPRASCPAVGFATGCNWIITINGDGSVGVQQVLGVRSYDGSEDVLVGVVNDSNALVSSVTLTGTDAFGFDGDGICTYSFTGDSYCSTGQSSGQDNSVGASYDGPINTFTIADVNDGTVNFTTPLVPGPLGATYFSLEEAPNVSGASAVLASDITVTGLAVAGTEGNSTGPVEVATFTDGPDTSPPADFSATTGWGDFTTASTSTDITQPRGTGTPYLVFDSHTYAEEGPYSTTVTVNDVHLAINYGTATGSATVVDAALTASTNPTITNATTNTFFTASVAAFTDANPHAKSSDYSASINWDDTTTSAGTISQIGTVFYVSGTHKYAANGTYTVTVTVTDEGGSTLSLSSTVNVYDKVIDCSSSCSGTLTNSQQSTGASSSSTTGTIGLDLGSTTSVGAFSCGDPFRHAPQYSTIIASGLTASGSIALKVTFNNNLAAGPWWDPFAVCYDSPGVPFTTLFGLSKNLGLLPFCPLPRPGHPVVGPCVQSIRYSTIIPLPSEKGTVTEQLILPPNDPFSH